MKNMGLWNSVCVTKPSDTKRVRTGMNEITAICAQSQRKRATEAFGPFGMKWGIHGGEFSFREIGDVILARYDAKMFYILESEQGQIPIHSNLKIKYISSKGKIVIDDEYAKKMQTDALTKGLSMLGFNSDVFEGKFDDSKYVSQLIEQEQKGNAEQMISNNFDNLYRGIEKLALSFFNSKYPDKAEKELTFYAKNWCVKHNEKIIPELKKIATKNEEK